MPKLRLYEFEFTVTWVTEHIDKTGERVLLASGYHSYDNFGVTGSKFLDKDEFSYVVLRGSPQLLDETKRRFFKSRQHRLKIDVLDADIVVKSSKKMAYNNMKGHPKIASLLVYFYDFKHNRLGTRKLIKKLREQ